MNRDAGGGTDAGRFRLISGLVGKEGLRREHGDRKTRKWTRNYDE
jgi:hypothetical protein